MKKRRHRSVYFPVILAACVLCFFLGRISAVYKFEKMEMRQPQKSGEEGQTTEKMTGSDMEEEQETEPGSIEGSEPETEIKMEVSADTEEKTDENDIWEEYLAKLSTEQKVAQLFIITPDALTGIDSVTAAGESTYAALEQYPVGGLIYFQNNLLSYEQISDMLHTVQDFSMEISGLPLFLATDEEGGSVARISGQGFGIDSIEDMAQIGANEDYDRAAEVGRYMGSYLCELGFNVDFAPCADVLTNSANTVVSRRSFGSDAKVVADMVEIQMKAFEKEGILGVPKHFPGHGATSEDSHEGYASIYKTADELDANEWLPFKEAIRNGAKFIMVGHIACPQITNDNTPASMSHYMVTELLRNTLGFDGLVVTDALNMGAVSQNYSSADAAVAAIQAGADLLLMPTDFYSAYYGVVDAVYSGEITEERLNESIKRILKVKNEIRVHNK